MITIAEIEEVLDGGDFTPTQTRALVKAMELAQKRERDDLAQTLATKRDLGELKTELFALIGDAKADMMRFSLLLWIGLVPVIALLFKYVK